MIIGIILAILLLLLTVQSTIFFLIIKKVKFIEWLFFNPCAISCIFFIIGFVNYIIYKNNNLIYFSIVPMFYFGTLSLFFLPWNKLTIPPQIHHIIMTLSISWTLWETYKNKNYQSSFIYLIIGIIVFSLFIKIREIYAKKNEVEFMEKIK